MLIAGLWLAEHFLFALSSSYDALLIIQSQSFYNVLFIHILNVLAIIVYNN